MGVLSSVEKPTRWTNGDSVCVLQRQERTVAPPSSSGDTGTAYRVDFVEYTRDEWTDLVTSGLQVQVETQISCDLDTVRKVKIAESKQLLEQYYRDHPITSSVHGGRDGRYAVTSDKQSYLLAMITMCDQAASMGVPFSPTWNETGGVCEPWTADELKKLSFQVLTFVYPKVRKQQHYESEINQMTDVNSIRAMKISYDD